MVLDVGPQDFASMLLDWGRTVTRIPQVAGAADVLGEKTYSDGASSTFQAIVQDSTTQDLKVFAGILQAGDRVLYAVGTLALSVTDVLLLDGTRYRLVEESVQTHGDTPLKAYSRYFVRKAR